MKKFFSFSFQHKVILVLVLFMNVPFFFTGYMAKNLIEKTILHEKEDKLLALAHVLDAQLDPGGYEAILQRYGMENADREVKIRVLNQALANLVSAYGMRAYGPTGSTVTTQ